MSLVLMCCIQHCFICRLSGSTVSEDAGIEPRTVATFALAVKRSSHSARSKPQMLIFYMYRPKDSSIIFIKTITATETEHLSLKLLKKQECTWRPHRGSPGLPCRAGWIHSGTERSRSPSAPQGFSPPKTNRLELKLCFGSTDPDPGSYCRPGWIHSGTERSRSPSAQQGSSPP